MFLLLTLCGRSVQNMTCHLVLNTKNAPTVTICASDIKCHYVWVTFFKKSPTGSDVATCEWFPLLIFADAPADTSSRCKPFTLPSVSLCEVSNSYFNSLTLSLLVFPWTLSSYPQEFPVWLHWLQVLDYPKMTYLTLIWGRGSGSTLARSVCMVCDREIDGSSQLSSLCFDHVNNSHSNCESPTCSSQCRRLVQQKPCHVLSCPCDNACKRSLAICRKSRALCPVSRLLSVPI